MYNTINLITIFNIKIIISLLFINPDDKHVTSNLAHAQIKILIKRLVTDIGNNFLYGVAPSIVYDLRFIIYPLPNIIYC